LHINTQKATNPNRARPPPCVLDARNHYPQIKHHTPPPKQGDNQSYPRFPTRDEEIAGLLPQSPIVCLAILTGVRSLETRTGSTFVVAPEPHPLQAPSISRIAQVTEPPHAVGGP
jgi:hypothetical protein